MAEIWRHVVGVRQQSWGRGGGVRVRVRVRVEREP